MIQKKKDNEQKKATHLCSVGGSPVCGRFLCPQLPDLNEVKVMLKTTRNALIGPLL